ncbi:6683_t:CDS:2, partial [Ambispora leptoticha]
RYLNMGDYEEAFLKALASSDLTIILRLCHKVSPKNVFFPSRPLLSQPVILSLIHQLTIDLSKYTDLKFAWIEEALLHVNPKDTTISSHCPRILAIAKQRLVDRYTQMQMSSEENQNHNLKQITVLIHVLNSILRE